MHYVPAKLLTYVREGFAESEYFGFLAVFDKNKKLLKKGDPKSHPFFLRSLAKPVQAGILFDDDLRFEKLRKKILPHELAMCCGSHSGSQMHIDALKMFAEKFGINAVDLKCGKIMPLSQVERARINKGEVELSVFHNNCSAKHLLMLAICNEFRWNFDDYLESDSAIQKFILEKHKEVFKVQSLSDSKDGCNAPIWAVPFDNIAKGFLDFFTDPKNIQMKRAILENPQYFGGAGRIDSELIKASNGRLIAKAGAGGLIFVINLESEQIFMLKLLQENYEVRTVVTIDALLTMGWLRQSEIQESNLKDLYSQTLTSQDGTVVCEAISERLQ